MSEKIYAWLLRLYPATFRSEYHAAALQLFRDRARAEHGFFARCRLWLDVIVDLAVSIPVEYRRRVRPAKPQPGIFRLSEEDVAAMMNGWRMSRTTLMLYFYTALALGIGMGWLGGAPHQQLFVMYGLLAPFGLLAHYWRTNRFKRFWLGYELVVGADRIRQKHASKLHDVTVLRTDVTSLIESHSGFGVVTGQLPPAIWVPSQLSEYELVHRQLTARMPIIRPEYLHDDRAIFRPGRAVKCLIIATYVPAALVQSLFWFLPLALVSVGVLFMTTKRQRRERGWVKGVIIPLVGLVPLIINAIALSRMR
jgi:hypothetical protein